MKILQSRNFIFFNLLFLSLISPNLVHSSTEIISKSNFTDENSKKLYLKETSDFQSFFNDQLYNKLSKINLNFSLKFLYILYSHQIHLEKKSL